MFLVRRILEQFAGHNNLEYLSINSVNEVGYINEHALMYQTPEDPYVDFFIPRAFNDCFWCTENARRDLVDHVICG